jgi:NAD(P)H-dependent FMN reductase
MPSMPRLLLIPGSQRRASHNAALAAEMASRLQTRCQVDLLHPSEVALPLFDEDLEADPLLMQRVETLHRRFLQADGLVVATPEYNGQLPPYLKNLLDWVSRLPHVREDAANAFAGRPVLLCSASTGASGGALAIPHARALFGHLSAMTLGETVCVPCAYQVRAGDGYSFDPFFDAQVDAACESLLHWARAHAASRPAKEAACSTC